MTSFLDECPNSYSRCHQKHVSHYTQVALYASFFITKSTNFYLNCSQYISKEMDLQLIRVSCTTNLFSLELIEAFLYKFYQIFYLGISPEIIVQFSKLKNYHAQETEPEQFSAKIWLEMTYQYFHIIGIWNMLLQLQFLSSGNHSRKSTYSNQLPCYKEPNQPIVG